MAISKVILNGDTLMDVTSDTVEAEKLLSNETATKNDGTKVTGNIVSKSSTDLTVSGATVTAPAGYYSSAVSKVVATGSAFPPAVTITKAPTFSMNSSTGVITASYTGSSSITPTVNAGYISQGTAGTISTTGSSTYTLTTQGAQTITPGSTAQTIASYQWLTGPQTIAGDSNLTAENIAEGVPIFGVTGTHSGEKKYYATITSGDGSGNVCAKYPGSSGTKYYNTNDKFEITEGSIIYLRAIGRRVGGAIYINGTLVAHTQDDYATYLYTVPSNTDVEISLSYQASGTIRLTEVVASLDISENGTYNVSEYDFADVNVENKGFTADQIAMRTISGDISGNALTIGGYAFHNCQGITTANFPSCEQIYLSAFAYCYNLTTVSFPVCSIMNSSAFYRCSSLTIASFPACKIVDGYAFAYCTNLTTVSFPVCAIIGASAFFGCSSLTAANFPACTTISGSAFDNCRRLTTANFPACTTIGSYAFNGCLSLTTISFPSCVLISSYAFNQCQKIITADFPACTTIRNYAFSVCVSLTTISFPVCTSIGAYAFFSCKTLSTVNFPKCTTINSNAFCYCNSLTSANFPACTSIGSYAFNGCNNLLSLYLLGSSVPTLTSFTAFNSTPIDGYTTSTGGVYGSIYVPASLYNDYITATNWSYYSSRFVSV